jgi:hypothetical protein
MLNVDIKKDNKNRNLKKWNTKSRAPQLRNLRLKPQIELSRSKITHFQKRVKRKQRNPPKVKSYIKTMEKLNILKTRDKPTNRKMIKKSTSTKV